ncbi:DUF397 domain-containing protein [Streptomyces sp. NPDC058417]|uniref:DUF397 domain-containing protein n=1 Tax=unclassified Streptomyces TaxID=2593676 RepID=UPI003648EFE8
MSKVVGPFRKSSYSGQNGNCLEAARTSDDGRVVRDSKQPDGPHLAISRNGWMAFLSQFA